MNIIAPITNAQPTVKPTQDFARMVEQIIRDICAGLGIPHRVIGSPSDPPLLEEKR